MFAIKKYEEAKVYLMKLGFAISQRSDPYLETCKENLEYMINDHENNL